MHENSFIKCKSYSEAYCPQKCNCKSGVSGDGGKPVNSGGVCEHFCSKYGFCGTGENYESGIDCRECKIGKLLKEKSIHKIDLVNF